MVRDVLSDRRGRRPRAWSRCGRLRLITHSHSPHFFGGGGGGTRESRTVSPRSLIPRLLSLAYPGRLGCGLGAGAGAGAGGCFDLSDIEFPSVGQSS